MNDLIQWLETHQATCLVNKTFGTECPGCGFRRSLIELLSGNFESSFSLYPPLVFWLVTAIFYLIHVTFKLKHGANILKFSFMTSVTVVILNY